MRRLFANDFLLGAAGETVQLATDSATFDGLDE